MKRNRGHEFQKTEWWIGEPGERKQGKNNVVPLYYQKESKLKK